MEYEQAIVEDLKLLDIDVTNFTHTSDWFDHIEAHCEKLLKEGSCASLTDSQILMRAFVLSVTPGLLVAGLFVLSNGEMPILLDVANRQKAAVSLLAVSRSYSLYL